MNRKIQQIECDSLKLLRKHSLWTARSALSLGSEQTLQMVLARGLASACHVQTISADGITIPSSLCYERYKTCITLQALYFHTLYVLFAMSDCVT